MAYERKISRQHPGLIVLVLDDSGSMNDPLPGTSDKKWKWVDRLVGIILKELLARSTEMKGDSVAIKPRYYIHIIRYGSHPENWGDGLMDIEQVVQKFADDQGSLGLGGKLGGTDADAALRMAHEFLKDTVTDERFGDSFSPMLFHLTDGESGTDATGTAEQIMNLKTSDGNVLMVNAYIGTQTDLSYAGPEDFPGYVDVAEAGGGEDNNRMFSMSSVLPACIHQNLVEDGIFPNLREGARLFFDIRTKEMLKHTVQVVGSQGSRADRQVR